MIRKKSRMNGRESYSGKISCPYSSGKHSGVRLWNTICGYPIGKVQVLSRCVYLNV